MGFIAERQRFTGETEVVPAMAAVPNRRSGVITCKTLVTVEAYACGAVHQVPFRAVELEVLRRLRPDAGFLHLLFRMNHFLRLRGLKN